ncbi:MAG: hypothetical protein R3B49_05295 [Phycisphaerales bacterium]
MKPFAVRACLFGGTLFAAGIGAPALADGQFPFVYQYLSTTWVRARVFGPTVPPVYSTNPANPTVATEAHWSNPPAYEDAYASVDLDRIDCLTRANTDSMSSFAYAWAYIETGSCASVRLTWDFDAVNAYDCSAFIVDLSSYMSVGGPASVTGGVGSLDIALDPGRYQVFVRAGIMGPGVSVVSASAEWLGCVTVCQCDIDGSGTLNLDDVNLFARSSAGICSWTWTATAYAEPRRRQHFSRRASSPGARRSRGDFRSLAACQRGEKTC